MKETPFQDCANRGNSAEITVIVEICGNEAEIVQKLCGKFHFRIRKSDTEFNQSKETPFQKGFRKK